MKGSKIPRLVNILRFFNYLPFGSKYFHEGYNGDHKFNPEKFYCGKLRRVIFIGGKFGLRKSNRVKFYRVKIFTSIFSSRRYFRLNHSNRLGVGINTFFFLSRRVRMKGYKTALRSK